MCFPEPNSEQKSPACHVPLAPLACQRAPAPLQIEAQGTAVRPGRTFQPARTRAVGPVVSILGTSVPESPQAFPLLPASERGTAWWSDPKASRLTTSGSPRILWAAYPHSPLQALYRLLHIWSATTPPESTWSPTHTPFSTLSLNPSPHNLLTQKGQTSEFFFFHFIFPSYSWAASLLA